MDQQIAKKKSKAMIWLIIGAIVLSAGSCEKIPKEAITIVVVDPTSSNSVAKDARQMIVKRIKSAFGQTPVDGGGFVGTGLDGNIEVLPVSGFTDITSRIPVLDKEEISNFKTFVIGANTKSRATTIYKALLGSKTESFWTNLVDSQVQASTGPINFKNASCKNAATSYLAQAESGSSLERALKYAKDARTELPAKACELLGKITGGVGQMDRKLNQRSAACTSGKSQKFYACSDVKGSIKAINKLLVDLRADEDEFDGLKTGGCVLYASDMMNFNSEGPLPNWETVEQARTAGKTDASNLLPGGFPTMKLGVHVYMPNLGIAIHGGDNSPERASEMTAYWTTLFESLNADVGYKSADTACNDKEFH